MENLKCPKCKQEMSKFFGCEFRYHPELDNEDDIWSLIKGSVKEEGFECFDCGIIMEMKNGNQTS